MITLLRRWLFGRVRLQPSRWHDWRKPCEIDRGWELLYRARLNHNLFERNRLVTRIEADADYVPDFLRVTDNSIRRQAA